MARKREEQHGLLAHILTFVVCMAIGYFLGLSVMIAIFVFLSEFMGAIGTLLGTILGLALLFIMLFSFTWIGIMRTAIYGLIAGVIMAIIINHPFIKIFSGQEPGNIVISYIPIAIVIAIIILIIIYFILRKYKIVKRKDLMVIESRGGRGKK